MVGTSTRFEAEASADFSDDCRGLTPISPTQNVSNVLNAYVRAFFAFCCGTGEYTQLCMNVRDLNLRGKGATNARKSEKADERQRTLANSPNKSIKFQADL